MKLINPFMLLATLLTVGTFFSCSKDDDNVEPKPDIDVPVTPDEDKDDEIDPEISNPVTLLTPCDIQATENTKKLFTFLKSIYGEKTLASTMANVSWNTTEAEYVAKSITNGRYPAMNCFDYIHISHSSPGSWIDYSNIEPVENWAKEGGLVSLMWHANVPKSENNKDPFNYTCTTSETTFQCKNILIEGTWENEFFYVQLDKVCESILKLQDAGIPAIWRPFHEAAGNIYNYNNGTAWFWWGANGGDVYVELWKTTFKYFQSKGIHNLIWAWTTEGKDADFYPGDEYVDIIGRDLYGQSTVNTYSEWLNVNKIYSHKMIALTECGNKVENGKVTSQAIIVEQWNKGCRWLYFMPWYDYDFNEGNTNINSMCDKAFWENASRLSYVLMRDDVKGIYTLD